MQINYSNIKDVEWIFEQNKAIVLLRKENAPLIISFLYSIFKERGKNSYSYPDVVTLLSDYLYQLNLEEDQYKGAPAYYLENWSKDGFIKIHYDKSDEPLVELMPASESAIRWLTELNKPEFVGTESRLLQIFDMLKKLVIQSSDDISLRRQELLKERERIDQELHKINKGEYEKFDKREIVEQFLLIEETAGRLLSDFRQIEENFRQLNTSARESQIKKNISKGKLLEDVFKAQDLIMETDQGKSFTAFWEFLMNQQKQDELDELIQKTTSLPEVTEMKQNAQLQNLKLNLVQSGEKVYRTTGLLVEQLRKFLDSRMFIENRRIAEVIKAIEAVAVSIRNAPPTDKDFFLIDDSPAITFPLEQKLWEPVKVTRIADSTIEEAEDEGETGSLYQQLYVNPEVLKERISMLLRGRQQISLPEIIQQIPVEKGLSELVAYFSIATSYEKINKAVINEDVKEAIEYINNGKRSKVEFPQTIFLK